MKDFTTRYLNVSCPVMLFFNGAVFYGLWGTWWSIIPAIAGAGCGYLCSMKMEACDDLMEATDELIEEEHPTI